MGFLRALLGLVLLFCCSTAVAAGTHISPATDHTVQIDQLVHNAIASGLIAGGVVLIGDRQGILFEKPYGRASAEPDAGPMGLDTIFDLASLTKVVATTPAILRLAEQRKLSLVDPVLRWFPEFAGKGKEELLVLNLLTHTSGLDDFPLSPLNPLQSAVEGAASQKSRGEIGSRFRYADINFILLGEMVRRVTGTSLDSYASTNFYLPLGMKDTRFSPLAGDASRCSATLGEAGTYFVGVPQDFTSRQLGGVAGHAGLFSTARDLALFGRMLMGEGALADIRVLSGRAVQQMTAPYFSRGGQVIRGLGWDRASPFSSPRGGFSETSFGHTGYSGTSLWIDPSSNMFVMLLAVRLDFRRTSDFSRLRAELSSLAGTVFGPPTADETLPRAASDVIVATGK